jgi:hypothetical protein
MPPQTAIRAGRLIEEMKAVAPATEKQLAFLERLGWEGEPPTTKRAASSLIEDLLNDKENQ